MRGLGAGRSGRRFGFKGKTFVNGLMCSTPGTVGVIQRVVLQINVFHTGYSRSRSESCVANYGTRVRYLEVRDAIRYLGSRFTPEPLSAVEVGVKLLSVVVLVRCLWWRIL